MSSQDWATATTPGQTPKITSIYDFSAEALGQLKVWLEQSGLQLPPVIGGSLATYTPAWTASGVAPALGNGSITGKYTRTGRFVSGSLVFVPGTSSTFGTGNYSFSLPLTPAASAAGDLVGSFQAFDSSAASIWTGVCQIDGATNALTLFFTAVTNYTVGATVPFTFAQDDQVKLNFGYEMRN